MPTSRILLQGLPTRQLEDPQSGMPGLGQKEKEEEEEGQLIFVL